VAHLGLQLQNSCWMMEMAPATERRQGPRVCHPGGIRQVRRAEGGGASLPAAGVPSKLPGPVQRARTDCRPTGPAASSP